jgi:hypothetical protein
MSDAWRADNVAASQRDVIRKQGVASFPKKVDLADAQTKNALTKHYHEAEQAHIASSGRRAAKWDAGYPKGPKSKPAQKRVAFKGQDMTEKNFNKSFKMSGSYKYGSIVSKEAMRTSPNVRLSGGGTGAKKALLDSYGSKGFKNYKTRSYSR